MKKLLFLLLVSVSIHAQFKFGPTAGLTLHKIQSSSVAANPEPLASYYAGLFAEGKFSRFGVAGEINYAELKSRVFITTLHDIFTMQTLNFYVFAKFYPINNLSVGVGPFFQDIISAKSQAADYSQDFSRTNSGIAVDISAKIYKGLAANARYSFGLTNVVKISQGEFLAGEFDPYLNANLDLEAHNSFFTAGLSYNLFDDDRYDSDNMPVDKKAKVEEHNKLPDTNAKKEEKH